MFKTLANYFSLIKFSHTIFAMPFAMIGFFLGFLHVPFNPAYHDYLPGSASSYFLLNLKYGIWLLLILVILCMIFARSAAMAFNRYIDEQFDKLNPRTAVREIPAGVIKKQHALLFVVINCILFILTTFFINRVCFYLSPVALFVILFYSYTKRFTPLCHLVLGLGLSLAPIGAYLAVMGHFHILPVLFSAIVFTWVSGFDILYALQDEEFDRANHLKSIPVLLGRKNAMYVSDFLHFVTAILVACIGYFYMNNIYFYIGAALFIGLLFFQHTLVKPNDISKVNLAFGTTNGIASILFSLFVILSIFLS